MAAVLVSCSAMKMQRFTAMKMSFLTNSQGLSKVKSSSEELISNILNRKWRMHLPDTNIDRIRFSPIGGINKNGPLSDITYFMNNSHPCLSDQIVEKDSQHPSFYIVRDDLLHPLVNGNKARKLDGLLPLLVDHLVTDVVTCGGCQSAHAAAVAVSCGEIGIKSHLLLRGEQPKVLTGYNLISTLYGNVTYVPRHLYAQREKMLKTHANLVAGNDGKVLSCNDILQTSCTSETSGASNMGKMNSCTSIEDYPRKVLIINEGAGDVVALLGAIRLVKYLCQSHLLGRERRIKLVVDAGTGTTAIGLGLGALCLGVPWEVTALMLVETIDAFRQREKCLISDFRTIFGDHCLNNIDNGVVHWVERNHKRKFGNVLEGEIEACQRIARQTGILVDPVYTLAAWELAVQLSNDKEDDAQVVMLHTGGTLGMFGLAQRYKTYFQGLKH